MIVYCFTNKVNNKKYVGITIHTLDYRWQGHCKQARSNCDWRFHQAIRKHGENAFFGEILETCATSEELDVAEQKWVKYFNTYNYQFGYNMTQGGGGTVGKGHSEETRHLMSELAKVRHVGEGNPMFGTRHSEESKEKNRQSQLGKKHSEVTKQKMSESRSKREISNETCLKLSESLKGEKNPWYGIHGSQHPRFGKKLSEETKLKISEAQKKRLALRKLNKSLVTKED